MPAQRLWQRIILLTVLGYEGLGALVGGSLLVAKPDGRYMDMPVGIMHGTFRDFLIPGLILFGLGLVNVAAFVAVLRKIRADWIWAGLAVGGLAVWFFVEVVILRELHWLHIMWGFPVILGGAVALPLLPFSRQAMRDAYLICGVASSLLYVAMNLIVPVDWPEYNSASQVISELSATGAPSRPLWVILGMVYTVLVTAFGWGVRMAGDDNRRLRIAGTLIAVYGAMGILWVFAPMHTREVTAAGGGSFSDTMHVALGAATEIIYLFALGFAAAALGKAFRVYSIATFIVLFAFGIPLFRDVPRVGANLPTPYVGVWERINIGVFLVWIVVLAIALLRRGFSGTELPIRTFRYTREDKCGSPRRAPAARGVEDHEPVGLVRPRGADARRPPVQPRPPADRQ
jgi:hypothetical protein